MGLIHIYSHIDEEHKTYNVTGKIKNLFPEIDFAHYVILKNGYRIDSDYEVKENDVIFARKIPTDPVSIGVLTVGFSLLAGVSLAVGLSAYLKNKNLEESIEALKNANEVNSNALPFLKGANNQSAQGRTFPFVIGKHYFTPYRLAPKYYSVSGVRGKNQYVYMILETGFNDLLIESISLGNIPVYKKSSDFAQNDVFKFIENSTYYDDENLIEIRQGGDFENDCFNKKVVSNYYGSEIKHDFDSNAEKVVKQLETNSKGFDVCILFNGLYKTENNQTTAENVKVNVYYSNKESPDPENLSDWTAVNNGFIQYGLPLTVSCTGWFKARVFSYGTKKYIKTDSKIKDVLANTVNVSWNGKDVYSSAWQCVDGTNISSDTVKDESQIVLDTVGDIQFNSATKYYYRDVEFRFHWNKKTTQNVFSNDFNYNTTESMRFVCHKDFTPSEALGKNMSVMIERVTPKEESGANDSVYLNYINSYIYDPNKSSSTELVDCKPLEDEARDKCTRIAVKMKATDSNADLTDSFNVIASGFARVYITNEETGIKEWTTWKELTSNPASWILEILTSEHHAHSKFEDDEIDFDSFAELYEYCEENEIEVNGVITDSGTKLSIINDLLTVCHSSLFYNADGLLEVATDKEEEYPVALLNSQNIIDVTVTKDFSRKADGRKITFTNADSWSKESVYLMKDGTAEHTQNDVITELAPNYITNYNQVIKYARRDIAESLLQRKTISVNVGKEGAYYPLFSCVDVQLPQLQKGIVSSVIKGVNYSDGLIESIIIADTINADSSKNYGVIIQAQNDNGKNIFNSKCHITADSSNVIVFDEEINPDDLEVVFESGNIISFGELTEEEEFDYVKTRFKIYGIEPSNNGYKLELKEYNSAIYEEGTIPEYKSTVAPRSINFPETKIEDSVSVAEYTQTKILQTNAINTMQSEVQEVVQTVSKIDSSYNGAILTLDDIPAEPKANDYFVWGGDTTESELAEEGSFAKGQCYYAYYDDGEFSCWKISENEKQLSVALKDIFNYMDTDNPNTFAIAFIQNLFANKITVGEEIKSANYETATYSNKGSGFCLKADGSAEINKLKVNYTELKADEDSNISLGHNNFNNKNENTELNCAIGNGALLEANGAWNNIAIGSGALSSSENAESNISIGVYSMYNANSSNKVSGKNNIAIGTSAGANLSSGSNNVFIGGGVNGINSGNRNVYIGNLIVPKSTTENDEVNIGNSIRYDTTNGFRYKDESGNPKQILKGYICESTSHACSVVIGGTWISLGDVLHVVFWNEIQTSNPTTYNFKFGVKRQFTDEADFYPVKIFKNGSLINLPSYKLKNETKYNFLQAGTGLDLMFCQNSDGCYWLVLGNPLVHSYNNGQSSNYKIYADGYKKIHGEVSKTISSSAEQSITFNSPVTFSYFMNKVVGVARQGYSSSTHYVIQKGYEYSTSSIVMNVLLTSYSVNNTITCIFDGEGY